VGHEQLVQTLPVPVDRDLETALLDTCFGTVVGFVGRLVDDGANPIIALVFCSHDRGHGSGRVHNVA
jgi:hypothetical protein